MFDKNIEIGALAKLAKDYDSIPFSLAVMVKNNGGGAARNLSLASAQPQIVDNEKGLLIAFNIIGTEVTGQALSPSLTVNFGTIEPGQTGIGRWPEAASSPGPGRRCG